MLLSQAYRARVVAFQAKLLGGNRDAAVEAWNDTLLDVWDRIDDYDPGLSKFRTWLYNTARYQALAKRRQLARDQRVDAADRRTEPEDAKRVELPEPPSSAERAALQRAFRQIKGTERRLLWYRHVEGWMPVEIVREGLVTGVSESAVRVYLNRAAARLKERFEAELRKH